MLEVDAGVLIGGVGTPTNVRGILMKPFTCLGWGISVSYSLRLTLSTRDLPSIERDAGQRNMQKQKQFYLAYAGSITCGVSGWIYDCDSHMQNLLPNQTKA